RLAVALQPSPPTPSPRATSTHHPTEQPAWDLQLAGGERECGGYDRAAAGGALDLEPPAEGCHPVAHPDQPVAVGIGTSCAVVANLDAQHRVLYGRDYLGASSVRVLDDVGQR